MTAKALLASIIAVFFLIFIAIELLKDWRVTKQRNKQKNRKKRLKAKWTRRMYDATD